MNRLPYLVILLFFGACSKPVFIPYNNGAGPVMTGDILPITKCDTISGEEVLVQWINSNTCECYTWDSSQETYVTRDCDNLGSCSANLPIEKCPVGYEIWESGKWSIWIGTPSADPEVTHCIEDYCVTIANTGDKPEMMSALEDGFAAIGLEVEIIDLEPSGSQINIMVFLPCNTTSVTHTIEGTNSDLQSTGGSFVRANCEDKDFVNTLGKHDSLILSQVTQLNNFFGDVGKVKCYDYVSSPDGCLTFGPQYTSIIINGTELDADYPLNYAQTADAIIDYLNSEGCTAESNGCGRDGRTVEFVCPFEVVMETTSGLGGFTSTDTSYSIKQFNGKYSLATDVKGNSYNSGGGEINVNCFECEQLEPCSTLINSLVIHPPNLDNDPTNELDDTDISNVNASISGNTLTISVTEDGTVYSDNVVLPNSSTTINEIYCSGDFESGTGRTGWWYGWTPVFQNANVPNTLLDWVNISNARTSPNCVTDMTVNVNLGNHLLYTRRIRAYVWIDYRLLINGTPAWTKTYHSYIYEDERNDTSPDVIPPQQYQIRHAGSGHGYRWNVPANATVQVQARVRYQANGFQPNSYFRYIGGLRSEANFSFNPTTELTDVQTLHNEDQYWILKEEQGYTSGEAGQAPKGATIFSSKADFDKGVGVAEKVVQEEITQFEKELELVLQELDKDERAKVDKPVYKPKK